MATLDFVLDLRDNLKAQKIQHVIVIYQELKDGTKKAHVLKYIEKSSAVDIASILSDETDKTIKYIDSPLKSQDEFYELGGKKRKKK